MADLIPLDAAVACIWPASATDKRLRLRIEPAPLDADRMRKLGAAGGYTTILDPTGTGDARLFWEAAGRSTGWADAAELRREMGKVDCAAGQYFRLIASQVGE